MDNSATERGSLGTFARLASVLGGMRPRTSCCSEACALLFRDVGTTSGLVGEATPKAAPREAESFAGKPVSGETSGTCRETAESEPACGNTPVRAARSGRGGCWSRAEDSPLSRTGSGGVRE